MTAKRSKAKTNNEGDKPSNTLNAHKRDNESQHKATARALLTPDFRHGQTAATLFHSQLKDTGLAPGLGDYADAIKDQGKIAESGDLAFASRLLAAQAMTLDNIFAEMARRMALNMGEHLAAMEIYARVALKAQTNSRATIEALAKLHQPREQTVRHVHVNEGGQAIITDQLHHHTGGPENGQSDDQPHATGTGAAGSGPALSGPDPFGQPMPIPSRKRQGKVQDARRQG